MGIKFDDVLGQAVVCDALSQNLGRDRVASTYLFSGPDGTGKRTAATIFAKALLCGGDGEKPCGRCKSCAMFESGAHPDFFALSPEGSRKFEKSGSAIVIEQVRDLISELSLKSYMGGRKVAIIHDADTMNRATANAILKTLEEPPAMTVIVLISSNPAALLPTILSRCRNLPFVPMRPEKLAEVLQKRQNLSPDEALRVALLADGCVGRAFGGEIEGIKEIEDDALELLSQMPDMRGDFALRFAFQWKGRRGDLPILVGRMAEILRVSQCREFGLSSGIMRRVIERFGQLPGDRVVQCYDILVESQQALRFNPNVQLFLESLVFDIQSVLQRGHRIGTTYY